MSVGALAPTLTEDSIIRQVLRLNGRSQAERDWYLRPDSPMRAAIRGELSHSAMSRPERIAARLGRSVNLED